MVDEKSDSDQILDAQPWVWWRRNMPICNAWTYFDHAAVGPLSQPAASAIAQYASEAACQGDTVWPSWAAKIDQLRVGFATLLNTSSADICCVPNTSTGINLVAEGWPWKPGDNVIVPEGEFPSNLFPWLNQQSRGVEVRVVPRRDGAVLVEDLISRVDDSTQMIAVSWVGYASGFRIDVDSLVTQAHAKGTKVFLDAIQGLGVFPLDLQKTPVDFLAADGHKWLLGPEGMGMAMIASQHRNRLRCGNIGWSSVKSSFNYAEPDMTLKDTAGRFEPGSPNMVGAAALLASLEMFLKVRQQHGDAAIGDRVVELATQLDSLLQAVGVKTRIAESEQNRSGIVTFDVPGCDPIELRKQAFAENIVLSVRDGGVRASIHAYNNEDDLKRLVDVVAKATA